MPINIMTNIWLLNIDLIYFGDIYVYIYALKMAFNLGSIIFLGFC
jgi:hypothetical protein